LTSRLDGNLGWQTHLESSSYSETSVNDLGSSAIDGYDRSGLQGRLHARLFGAIE
jgi:hypothetical protein